MYNRRGSGREREMGEREREGKRRERRDRKGEERRERVMDCDEVIIYDDDTHMVMVPITALRCIKIE